ncbi:hypothetical protein [Paraburkholderia sp. BL9I2N2]|uniref:hypothetical protein n=1 Tax=Paraburkholderia sp. BL9I2N2 TaxID=1938809 RepID=UPI0010516C0E|nr:hypothetical protein [Paraburkholderia sp. BL9I2N2]TCK94719.1 hypothetical protein B0G74_1314 [Paraburkholderia sp. BL9I2N2]
MKQEIDSVILHARNAPLEPARRISRDNVLDTIDRAFEANSIVFLEGDPLSGKSELAAQFMRRHEGRAIGAFLTAGAPVFYSSAFLRLAFAEQIRLLVGKSDTPTNADMHVSEALFNQYILRFQSLGRKRPITFIVDGLADSEGAARQDTLEIFNQLPAVQSEFRFLITGSDRLFQELPFATRGAVRIPRFALSLPESAEYLSDLKLPEEDVRALHIYSGGNIGSLSKLRVLVAEGGSLDELLAEKRGSLSKIFEFEWNALRLDRRVEEALAFIAFSHSLLTTDALAQLTGIDSPEVGHLLGRCRIVERNATGDTWSIRSDAQRQFVAEKLQALRKPVEENLIKRLIDGASAKESTVSLPSQLIAAGQHGEVLKRLTGEHFANLLAHENSLRVLRTHAEYGVVSARKNEDIYSELRFSLIQSTINGTTLAASSTYEIEALLSLGMEDAAAALALTAATPEQRLRQLAAAASCFRKLGKEPPDQVVTAIRELLKQLEGELSEPVLISIAAELLPVDVDLSLHILEKAVAVRRRQERSASKQNGARSSIEGADQDAAEAVAKLEAPTKLRPILDAAALFVRKMTAQEVLRRATDLEEPHRLFILQRWLEVHRRKPDAPEVALAALDIVLRATSTSPKIKDIREIAVVAPHIGDREQSERVTARLEAQSSELIGHGTTEEAVRLKMLLLRAKQRWSEDGVDSDLIELFAQVHGVSDVGIRTACYAWMLYHLGHLFEKDSLEARTGVIAETTRHLLEAIDILLSQTADHYAAAVDAIRAICMCDPRRAIDLVSRINTEERRNKGYGLIVRCIAVNKTHSENAEVLLSSIERITVQEEKEKLIVFLLFRMCMHLTAVHDATVDPRLLILWKRVAHPSRKMQAIVLTFKVIRLCAYLVRQESLIETAESVWAEIHENYLRVDAGYWAVSELAVVDKDLARKWLAMVREDAKASGAPSFMAGTQLGLIAGLAGRVFAQHVAANPQEYEPSLARLDRFVSMLPGLDDQAQIWTEVGVALWFKAKRDLGQRIVETKIEPLLGYDYEHNKPLLEDIVVNTAPLLYLTSAVAANARIDRVLPQHLRDEARDRICATIMRKLLPTDFYHERERAEFDLSYSEAMEVHALVSMMSCDSAIYRNVSRLCNSLSSKKNRGTIRRNQVADLLVDLKKTVESRLPDANNISHEGFLVACLAEIHRCRISETKQRDNGQWQALLRRAESIDNGADRVIVVSMVASCAGGGGPFRDNTWFDNVRRGILAIPSDRDRLERFQWVAEILESFDKPKCRLILKEAMLASSHLSDDSVIDKRQRILDLAHNIDPVFVDEIVDLLDNDEASQLQKKLLKEHSRLLDARKEAATDVGRLSLDEYSLEELSEIAIRSVSAMNAGRQIPQQTREFMLLADASKHYPFPFAYPVWLWIIESGLRKATQQSAQRTLPHMFECICNAAEVAVSLLSRSGGGVRTSLLGQGDTIGPGERGQLFSRIREWVAAQEDSKIRISDPYFGPDDLDVIRAIAEVAPEKEIVVLTSKEQMQKKVKGSSPEEAFRDAWDELCDGAPPQTEIIVVGFGPDGKHPIHDRWIVSSKSGLRLGTSPNSIGLVRISEISEMDARQTEEKIAAIERVLDRATRHWDNQKLHRARFSL